MDAGVAAPFDGAGVAAPSFVALALMREKAKEWPEAEALYRKAINAHAQNVPVRWGRCRLPAGWSSRR